MHDVRSVTGNPARVCLCKLRAILMRGQDKDGACGDIDPPTWTKPVADVWSTIIVIEADRNKTRDLAATFTTAATLASSSVTSKGGMRRWFRTAYGGRRRPIPHLVASLLTRSRTSV